MLNNENKIYDVVVEMVRGINRVYGIEVEDYLVELESFFEDDVYCNLSIMELIEDIEEYNKNK